MSADAIMADIMAAISLLHGGDRAGGRSGLEAVWTRIADAPSPFHECVLSHYLADAQDDISDELAWDIRALDAALRCTDEEAKRFESTLSLASFMPSLHLNLGEDYFKLGDLVRSKQHLGAAQDSVSSLADDSYGQLIRGGIKRLAAKLGAR